MYLLIGLLILDRRCVNVRGLLRLGVERGLGRVARILVFRDDLLPRVRNLL